MSTSKITAGAFAVAAAIGGLAAVALIPGTRSGDDATAPAPAASRTAAEQISTRFVEAYGALNANQAITYLADDADISGMTGSVGAPGTLNGFRLHLAWLEAAGYEQMPEPCEELGSSAAGSTVRCRFAFQAIRSDEIGLGPYGGSHLDLTVGDGEIVRASTDWEIAKFSPQLWEPFATWVSKAYPKDAAAMYGDATHSGPRLTAKSIRLWKQRSREYVEVMTAKQVEIAESFMEARNAYDAEQAMSLLADGTVTAQLLDDNAIDPDMPAVRLDHDELALALEAERLYGVRYEDSKCRQRDSERARRKASIICSYLMDNKLRQIAGYRPLKSSVGIGFRNHRIIRLSFPWLNVGFPSGVPPEGAKFVRWVGVTHPKAGKGLFEWVGQERVLNLTPESLALLPGYLEEYERSRSG